MIFTVSAMDFLAAVLFALASFTFSLAPRTWEEQPERTVQSQLIEVLPVRYVTDGALGLRRWAHSDSEDRTPGPPLEVEAWGTLSVAHLFQVFGGVPVHLGGVLVELLLALVLLVPQGLQFPEYSMQRWNTSGSPFWSAAPA